MIEILLFFVGASVLLYVLLGGADYGAGVLELLPTRLREKQKHLINHAMGPVWEANHMWLILVVVILFMGFPLIFTTVMTALHLPMVALLVGIVIRGCAFTFRHYDAVQTETSQNNYTWLFGLSSLWSSVWLGIIIGSLNRERINPSTNNFFEAYIAPWWGLYPFSMGLFALFIFMFLASIYLVGESDDEELQKLFLSRARILNILVVLGGGFVFLASEIEGGSLWMRFISHPITVMAMVSATLLYILLWFFISKRKALWTRLAAAAQVSFIILGWYYLDAPYALRTTEGPISFYEGAAPEATLYQLVIALCVGSVFIFPSLIYLLKVFKTGHPKGENAFGEY